MMRLTSNRSSGLWLVSLFAGISFIARAEPELVKAVKARDFEAVRDLLEQGVDVNAPRGDGTTALHWAAHRDDAATAELLLRAGARVGPTDDHGVTPLTLACLNGSAEMVEMLLRAGADANAARFTGETALMTAARVGNARVVGLLLAHGARVEAADSTGGQSALMLAVAENHPWAAWALLENGADPVARSTNRFTPLLFAAQQGNLDTAGLLLAAGADVNESAPDGIAGDTNARAGFRPNTEAAALLVAIDSGHEAVAAFLLENGADPDHHGAGRTALHSAVQQAMAELVDELLARGADPNARLEKPLPLLSRYIGLQNGLAPKKIGATPLWLAAGFADTRIMRLLVEAGADPTLTSNDGTTALMMAAGVDFVAGQDRYGRRWFRPDTVALQEEALDAVKLCLELGNDINAVNDRGQTAMHGAVYLGGTMLAQFLVDQGARIDVVNKRGQTPWMIGAKGEYRAGSFYLQEETARLLERLGADTGLGTDLGRNFERENREWSETER